MLRSSPPPWQVHLPFLLSSPKGICCCSCGCFSCGVAVALSLVSSCHLSPKTEDPLLLLLLPLPNLTQQASKRPTHQTFNPYQPPKSKPKVSESKTLRNIDGEGGTPGYHWTQQCSPKPTSSSPSATATIPSSPATSSTSASSAPSSSRPISKLPAPTSP